MLDLFRYASGGDQSVSGDSEEIETEYTRPRSWASGPFKKPGGAQRVPGFFMGWL